MKQTLAREKILIRYEERIEHVNLHLPTNKDIYRVS